MDYMITFPLLLLALAAGYGVLVVSTGQPKPLDKIGRIVGAIVLLVSAVSLLAMAVCGVKCASGKSGMCGAKGAKMCPYSGQSADAPKK